MEQHRLVLEVIEEFVFEPSVICPVSDNQRFPTKEEIVNECIRAYFMQVYESYSGRADPNDMMLRMMEEVLS